MQMLSSWFEYINVKVHADIQSVLAVHGLIGDSYSTWASGENIWLRDLLPSLPEFKNARIMTFGYDSQLFIQASEYFAANFQELLELTVVERLLNDLADMRITARLIYRASTLRISY